ncbi:MAG: HAD family hydrolase [Rhodobacteraceae bacterium]|nr:HAD family hydrolase [Paracoccaceae bacterium]
MAAIRGLIFDKDGTLFDFRATWGGWARRVVGELSEGSAERAAALSRELGFDLDTGDFQPDSPVIAHTPREIAEIIRPLLPGKDPAILTERLNLAAAETEMVETVPLAPLFHTFSALGLRVGLATNDSEHAAKLHLMRGGIDRYFGFVAGFDSGHGAKPDPGQLLAFALSQGLKAEEIAMVGDSRHDLVAAKAAGMRGVAVLTGIARAPELAPHADAVLPDIGHLPAWISTVR